MIIAPAQDHLIVRGLLRRHVRKQRDGIGWFRHHAVLQQEIVCATNKQVRYGRGIGFSQFPALCAQADHGYFKSFGASDRITASN